MPFILNGVTTINELYAFSFWVKSEESGSIRIYDANFASTTDWQKYSTVFAANNTKLNIYFTSVGTYYIYHSKLELGNKATDWTPAPEDMVDVNTFDEYKEQASAELAVTANEVSISVTESLTTKIDDGDKNLQDQLTEFRMNYDFTDEGQYIGKSDSNTKLHMSNDIMEILVNGSAVTMVSVEGFTAARCNTTILAVGDYSFIATRTGRLRIV